MSEADRQKFFEGFLKAVNASEMPFDRIKSLLEEKLVDIKPQDLTGKVAIVTGANVGIGYETVKALAQYKAKTIIMACRNAAKAEKAKAEIEEATGHKGIEIWEVDLASYASVKAFTKKFLATGLPLDILVSNAGVVAHGWAETVDGNEITIQVNHLANVLLILNLTPALLKAPSARVVVVASDVHYWAQEPQPDDANPVSKVLVKPDQERPFFYYPVSKLFNVLFAKEYAKRAPFTDKVWIGSANPGYTQSELGTKNAATGEAAGGGGGLPGLVKRTTYEGAKTIIFAAIDPNAGKSGAFYSEVRETKPRSNATGEVGDKFAANVWRDTINLIKPHLEESGSLEPWILN